MSTDRFRCLTTGCNPVMYGKDQAQSHSSTTGHRTAAWPVRSAVGKRRARRRNRTGYYDKYNTGAKSPAARFNTQDIEGGDTAFGEDDF